VLTHIVVVAVAGAQFWSFPGTAPGAPQNEPFLDFMYLVGNTSDAAVPKVISTSYSECESTVADDYMMRINTEFMKAGVRGISLLFASGDSGVAGPGGGRCERFCGQWPTASPFVTGVGGTTQDSPETAWQGSGGGFSDRFPVAPWQAAAVQEYFKVAKDVPLRFRFNRTGRGFPDVAAQATNYPVVTNNRTETVGGTSCSAPAFSGVVSLLNELRVQKGKATLGFLNPLLFQVSRRVVS
jgi:tripeptidyl-peptidase-1